MDNWKLRWRIAQSGMNKSEIAMLSKISRTTLDNLISDERNCKISSLESVCKTIGLDPSELFTGEPEPEVPQSFVPTKVPAYSKREIKVRKSDVLKSITSLVEALNRLSSKIPKMFENAGDEI